ncbi:hypothetical protein EMPS_04522 [Entomortierella parvispora]|uniref:DUF6787 domain-containing protein n=1 Tax=Entomortierella parvispora TaxID=205924 RepID=A0A9P3H8P9_9FUNG|nr:hypothetical protein EMPS_04522 [Entomortierella parvispora]
MFHSVCAHSNRISTISTPSSISFHTRSFLSSTATARSTLTTTSLFNAKPTTTRTSTLSSRAYTSSSSSTSSSSTASNTARILTQESSTTVATTTAKATMPSAPLTFHEEMTRVRFSYNWWKEWTIIMGVFAVTGSSTVMVVKPVLKEVFQLDGSMKEGPWSFRIAYLCTTLPLYSCVLLTVATIAGRRPYFKKVVLRMWGRFLPKKALARFQ